MISGLAEKLKHWHEKKVLYGEGWNNIEGYDDNGIAFGDDFLKAIAETKVNLNILRNQNKGAHNMRTFDIPACGGFMLHEYSNEAAAFFKEGVEAEFYRNIEECVEKIQYYSTHDTERNKIAQAGYNKVISAGYTYTYLAQKVIELSLENRQG